MKRKVQEELYEMKQDTKKQPKGKTHTHNWCTMCDSPILGHKCSKCNSKSKSC